MSVREASEGVRGRSEESPGGGRIVQNGYVPRVPSQKFACSPCLRSKTGVRRVREASEKRPGRAKALIPE